MPGKGRPFPKGVSGNPGGRPKVLGDVQDLARQKSTEAINILSNIMHDEKAPPAARVAAHMEPIIPAARLRGFQLSSTSLTKELDDTQASQEPKAYGWRATGFIRWEMKSLKTHNARMV